MNLNNQSSHWRVTPAVYNLRNPAMSLFSCLRWLCVLIGFSGIALAADWRTPEAQLAEKIAAVTGPGVIALQVNNGSSIPSAEVEAIRHGLIDDLANSGIRVWEPDQAAAVVTVTLSENLQSYIWIAAIQQGT